MHLCACGSQQSSVIHLSPASSIRIIHTPKRCKDLNIMYSMTCMERSRFHRPVLLLLVFSVCITQGEICVKPEGSTISNWSLHQGYCYGLYDSENMTFYEANTFCQFNGAFPTSIHSKEELTFLIDEFSLRSSPDKDFWIGLKISGIHSPYEWVDGTPLDFVNWSDEVGHEKGNKDDTCVSLDVLNGTWRKNACNLTIPVICKFQVNTSFPGFCRDGWYAYGNKCYGIFGLYINEKDSWPNARKKCKEMGSTLASIHSKEEDSFLTLYGLSASNHAWIGMHFMHTKNGFRWTDKSPLDFKNWGMLAGRPQPDTHGAEENCISKIWHDELEPGKWHDYDCVYRFSYICQTPKDPKQTKPGRDPMLCTDPDGWMQFGLSCYEVFSDTESNLTWRQAQSFCKNFSGDLATIRDHSVTQFLRSIVKGQQELFWVGLNNMEQDIYTWTGTPSVDYYSDWLDGIPPPVSNQRYCVAINTEGKWLTRDCSESHPFICEVGKGTNIPSSDPDLICPKTSEEWKDFGGRFCYFIEGRNYLSWNIARLRCLYEGGSLASFHSAVELQDVFYYLKSMAKDQIRVHIGFHQKGDGSFGWTDRSIVDYLNWYVGNPKPEADECVEAYTTDATWNDIDCKKKNGFICSVRKVPRNGSTLFQTEADANQDQDIVCPGGPDTEWEDFGGRLCYFIETRHRVMRSNAENRCSERGGCLAVFHSAEVLRKVRNNVTYVKTPLHIGFVKKQDGSYGWIDGSRVNYTNWAPGKQQENSHKECVGMDTVDGTWRKVLCKSESGFICSTPKVPIALSIMEEDVSESTTIAVSEGLGKDLIIVVASLGVLLSTAIFVSLFFLIRFYKLKKVQTHLLIYAETFQEGRTFNPDIPLQEQADLLPYDEKWEFPKARLKFGKTLGQGAFGRVVKGKAVGMNDFEPATTVAVKMAKDRTNQNQQTALMTELKILIHLGHHVNIMNLLGAVTKNPKGGIMVIVEYCRHGNIREYLLKHRRKFIPQEGLYSEKAKNKKRQYDSSESSSTDSDVDDCDATYPPAPRASIQSELLSVETMSSVLCDSSVDVSPKPGGHASESSGSDTGEIPTKGSKKKGKITTNDLISFAFQCARGMDYLASMKLIHRDLAARNILLADDNVVKISDFGLAKDLYDYPNYVKKGDVPLPIKWMAVESIGDRVFTTKSDVWSFGVLLWEFFTLGATPYPGIPMDENFYIKLRDGYRMEKPKFAPQNIYQIMLDCWDADPSVRPGFTQLTEVLGNLLEADVKQYYIDLNVQYVAKDKVIFDQADTNPRNNEENPVNADHGYSESSSGFDGYQEIHPIASVSEGGVQEEHIEMISKLPSEVTMSSNA